MKQIKVKYNLNQVKVYNIHERGRIPEYLQNLTLFKLLDIKRTNKLKCRRLAKKQEYTKYNIGLGDV